MNILRQTIGLVLIIIAWLNPFGFGLPFRIVFFVLGFDMLSLVIKIGVFFVEYLLNYFFDFGVGIGWILILLVIAEIITKFLLFKWVIDLIIKPVAVFVILFYTGIIWEAAVIVAGIDLLLNLTKKWF
jgi:hypothetical protein